MRSLMTMATVAMTLLFNSRLALADGDCDYQGRPYLSGSDVCQGNAGRFLCDDGVWYPMNSPCALHSVLVRNGCGYLGELYPSGRITCQSGTQQLCDGGRWQSLGTQCDPITGEVLSDGSSAAAVSAAAATTSCIYEGAEFLAQSIMCKEGSTFVCQGGRWANMRTPC